MFDVYLLRGLMLSLVSKVFVPSKLGHLVKLPLISKRGSDSDSAFRLNKSLCLWHIRKANGNDQLVRRPLCHGVFRVKINPRTKFSLINRKTRH